MKKKVLAMVLAVVLLAVCAVSGTLAWLTAKSDTVVNTFTTSDIKVELKETNREYKMIPGYSIDKDPTATVKAGSEKCYLFVKLMKSASYDDYLEDYEMADGWMLLETSADELTSVYYRVIDDASKMGVGYSVLLDDQVTVKGSVTKDMMNAIDNGTAAKPTLTITAYASQLYKNNNDTFSAAEAWANVTP